MHVEILGSTAGGGFPQWNFACRNCSLLRSGAFPGKARTQLQVVVSSDRVSWCLLNASPDLRVQIESNSLLHPRGGNRDSPISAVALTSADLDQCCCENYSPSRSSQPLRSAGFFGKTIVCFPCSTGGRTKRAGTISLQVLHSSCSPQPAREQSQIECLPLSVATRFPSYVTTERAGQLVPGEPALGLILRSESGKRLGYFPAVGQLNQALLDHLDSLDMLLFDGTFWSDDELITIQSGGQTARQMGHIPVSSATGSLDLLSKLCCPRKIFVHINNTNPMLDVTGPENHQVSESGWEIAKDGCHLEL